MSNGPSSKPHRTPDPGPAGEQKWTIQRLLEWTTAFFRRHEIEPARLDAEVLLAHAMDQDRLSLYLHYKETVGEDVLRVYRASVRRRRDREPIAYITGHREFYSLSFHVTPSVLIPRPESEHLVEFTLQRLACLRPPSASDPYRVLELGTGCGNLCISLATHLPGARVVSVDVSGEALQIARENARAHGVLGERLALVQADLLECLHPGRAPFDLVLSNPPYVRTEDWENLPEEIRGHEPRLALDGGAEGTDFQERILREAVRFLREEGVVLLEMGADQEDRLVRLAMETGAYSECRVLPDYAGLPRVLVAERRSRAGDGPTEG